MTIALPTRQDMKKSAAAGPAIQSGHFAQHQCNSGGARKRLLMNVCIQETPENHHFGVIFILLSSIPLKTNHFCSVV
jgi:hypothetical protein